MEEGRRKWLYFELFSFIEASPDTLIFPVRARNANVSWLYKFTNGNNANRQYMSCLFFHERLFWIKRKTKKPCGGYKDPGVACRRVAFENDKSVKCQQTCWRRAPLLNVNITMCLSLFHAKPMCENTSHCILPKAISSMQAQPLRLLIRCVKTFCVLQLAGRDRWGKRHPEYTRVVGESQDKFKINGLPMSRKFTRPRDHLGGCASQRSGAQYLMSFFSLSSGDLASAFVRRMETEGILTWPSTATRPQLPAIQHPLFALSHRLIFAQRSAQSMAEMLAKQALQRCTEHTVIFCRQIISNILRRRRRVGLCWRRRGRAGSSWIEK